MPDAPLYAPLDPDSHEIRLLRILPSPDKNNAIHLTLEVAILDSKLLYRALSYEWGQPDIGSPSTRVYLNSHDVPTTPNLRLALAHLEEGPYYWIDALCINQSDKSERGHQVQQMTRIYQQAYGIDVWLGLEEANSRLGIDLINQAESAWSEARIMAKGSIVKARWVEARLADRAYAAHWEGLRQVFQRSYWKRLWIIQELVVTLNPDAVLLHCGSTRASF
jgi:Heterokaryon incompatibility protein (HET)